MAAKVILVTGANRGIGFCTIQALAQRAPEHTYILAVRTPSSGEDAISKLKELGITSRFEILQLDITDDAQIQEAVLQITKRFGRLDVLINNAAIAQNPKPDNSDLRVVYSRVFDANITSVAAVTNAFFPLLKKSGDARVINVSSSRGSVTLQTTGQLPPTAAISYLVSKTAMNVLTLELRKLETDVLFHTACPGHCMTGLNGYRAAKDPLDGAKVIVELATSKRETYKSGFWQFEREEMREVPW